MKVFAKLTPVIINFLIMAAHLFRGNMIFLMVLILLLPLLLLWKSPFSIRLIQFSLLLFGFEWIRTIIILINQRIETGENWFRMTIILGIVALFNFISILFLQSKQIKKIYCFKCKN